MENDPDLEFEFFLAAKLGMTRAELVGKLSNQEFVLWSRYWMRRNAEQELELAKAKAGG